MPSVHKHPLLIKLTCSKVYADIFNRTVLKRDMVFSCRVAFLYAVLTKTSESVRGIRVENEKR
jgi:hypothetical protein